MADTLTNFPISAVATAPSPATSGTSLVVTASEGAFFPSTAFWATVCPAGTAPTRANGEVVRVTARSSDTMTITRAAGAGTTARTIVAGDQFFQCLPAEYFTQFEAASGRYNVIADGATGDGVTDDTAAIQATLNRFTNGVTATASGYVYFPPGTYKITAPLIYGGGSAYGLHLEGGIGGTRGPSGAQLAWYGAAGGTMFITNGANGCLFENLELYCRGIAKYGIHFAATNTINTTLGTVVAPGSVEVTPGAMTNIAIGTLLNIDAGASLEYVYVTAVTGSTFTATFTKAHGTTAVVGNSAGSSGIVLKRLTVGGHTGTGSAALAFGNITSAGTPQVSEVDMYDLMLIGDASTSVAGLVTLCSGNVKNFKLYGGGISGCQYGVDWANASGTFLVSGTILAGQTTADFRLGTGAMILSGVESEGGDDYLFVTGVTGTNAGSLVVTGCSWQGLAPSDDVMIRYSGNITLLGNYFLNGRTGSSVPKIETAGLVADGGPSTVFSQGNWFRYATAGFIPVVNSSGTSVWSAANGLLRITSFGDYGGDGGALVKLTNFVPAAVHGGVTSALGTITAAAPIVEATATWNNGAVTFTGIKLNVTNTASAAASKLADFQVGGSSMVSVNRDGYVTVNPQTGPYYMLFLDGNRFINTLGSNIVGFSNVLAFDTSVGTVLGSTYSFGWSASGGLTTGSDVSLFRDAANTLAQRNGVNAQTLRLYRTYTDSSNYERLALKSSAAIMEIAAETAGTGTDNIDVQLTPAGTGLVRFGTYTAGAPTVSGYLSVKAADGTIYKIAVGT